MTKDTSKYVHSKPFRTAWMMSLVGAVGFPFLNAIDAEGSSLSYLERVNEDFLKVALTFGFVFFVVQVSWGQFVHRRALKQAAEQTTEDETTS